MDDERIDQSLQPMESDAPTIVDGHVMRISERTPYLAPEPEEPQRERSALAAPFPVWLTIGAPIAMALTLGVVYLAEVNLLGGDWATGALAITLTAFAFALVTLAILIIRAIAGRRAMTTAALAGLLAISLISVGAGSVTQINPLRRAQAKSLEASHQWQAAIDEYTQAGQTGPNAPDIARIYSEWGEALIAKGDYAGAVVKLTTVVQNYSQSGADVARARADLYQTYAAWIRSGAITLPFQRSLDFLASYAKDPACDTACQQSVVSLQGQAHYQYGQQLAQAGQYKQAITEFELTQKQYAKTTFAAKAHTAAADAYLALGKQVLTQDCVTAVPYYQTLASRYGDTAPGRQAKTALAAPQKVKGVMTGFPTSPIPTVYLSKKVNPASNYYSDDYKATLNAKTGAFVFSAVKPGTYYLSTLRSTSSAYQYTYYKDTATGKPYGIQIGPLCAMDLTTLKY